MSCDKRCFDKESEYFGYDYCHTCPGRDDGVPISKRDHCKEKVAFALWKMNKEADHAD